MYLNRQGRHNILTLERRLAHLDKRIKAYRGNDNHRDRAEAGSLRWVLKILKEQDEQEAAQNAL